LVLVPEQVTVSPLEAGSGTQSARADPVRANWKNVKARIPMLPQMPARIRRATVANADMKRPPAKIPTPPNEAASPRDLCQVN
jgi:hypothetical protein